MTEPVNVASPGVTNHETPDVLVGSVYEYDHYGGNRPDCVDCAEPDDFDGYFYQDQIARVTPMKRSTHIGLVLVTRSPVLFTHLDRMAPMMETDRPYQDRIARVTPVKRPTRTGPGFGHPVIDVAYASRPDGTGDGDRPPSSG